MPWGKRTPLRLVLSGGPQHWRPFHYRFRVIGLDRGPPRRCFEKGRIEEVSRRAELDPRFRMVGDCSVPSQGIHRPRWSAAEDFEYVGRWIQLVADGKRRNTACQFVLDGGIGVEKIGVA